MDAFLNNQIQTALSDSNGARGPGKAANEVEARKVAEEFEAMFLSQLIEQMMGDSTESETFGGGPGEAAFKGLLNEEYAKVMAKAGGIGLADNLTREILRLQEAGETS